MNAVSYMRCSGKSQVDGDTWDRQIASIGSCAAHLGYKIEKQFREPAVPGKLDEEFRPAFREMIDYLLEGETKTIIVESMDRLAREYRTQESLITKIAENGLVLIAANTGENITEAMMGDPMRRALVQIQGILAELDKNLLVSKMRKAREKIRKNGDRCEGRLPYGSKAGEEETLSIMRGYHGAGFCFEDIARFLNTSGRFSRYGKPWNSGTISRILNRHNSFATDSSEVK